MSVPMEGVSVFGMSVQCEEVGSTRPKRQQRDCETTTLEDRLRSGNTINRRSHRNCNDLHLNGENPERSAQCHSIDRHVLI